MGSFILRRLIQAFFTLFGVMVLTFALFNIIAGDVTARFVNPKLGRPARVAWLKKNRLDLPAFVNLQRRVFLTDTTNGPDNLEVSDTGDSLVADALLIEHIEPPENAPTIRQYVTGPAHLMTRDTPLADISEAERWVAKAPPVVTDDESTTKPSTQPTTQPTALPTTQPTTQPIASKPVIVFKLCDGSSFSLDLSRFSVTANGKVTANPKATCGELIDLINNHPDNKGKLAATMSSLSVGNTFNSQFFWHFADSVTFQNRSFKTEEKLVSIVTDRAKYSLAITIPAMALGWLSAMVISSIVAYYRGSLIDKFGVFISVLGMCIPYLVYMIAGQMLAFQVAPEAAWGLSNIANIYVPITVALIAGLGYNVRFYRTVILDQVHQDYVRTARAKGASLPAVLFKHVLKNCMLPILTALVVSIPFMIMGSLLLERFFGVPGLGSLMLTSVSDRDVPIISGLTFLTAAIYVTGLLVTDILYAVFDPRIRLK
jgi:peptide/nickel transport system permease protein